MNYKKKKRLTPKQFQINMLEKRDTIIANSLIKQNGLKPDTFTTLDLKVAQAKIAAHDLLQNYSEHLTKEQSKQINDFNKKVANPKIHSRLKPNAAYPILNMATKIKRQAHQKTILTRQTIQALRYNQP